MAQWNFAPFSRQQFPRVEKWKCSHIKLKEKKTNILEALGKQYKFVCFHKERYLHLDKNRRTCYWMTRTIAFHQGKHMKISNTTGTHFKLKIFFQVQMVQKKHKLNVHKMKTLSCYPTIYWLSVLSTLVSSCGSKKVTTHHQWLIRS